MPTDIHPEDIRTLLDIAGIAGFTSEFVSLGGGEGNDTFVLDCKGTKVVLRIAKYHGANKLDREAKALSLLDLDQVPKLLYFNEAQLIKNRAWIAESYLEGAPAEKLNVKQFESLGRLLAHVHNVRLQEPTRLDFWKSFLDTNRHFGNEQSFLNHSDTDLSRLIRRSYDYFQSQVFDTIMPSLTHGDVSLNNMLIKDSSVSLIDWEFSRFTDPMIDFATMFYEDMAYNKGRWRIHIKPEDKKALFEGYARAGGIIDEQRLRVWFIFDKLGSAAYLYWKLHESNHEITSDQIAQYREDLEKLERSLERSL